MSKLNPKVVESAIRGIYATWHVCGLSKKDAKAMGLKPGRLCDDCESSVKAHMKDIRQQSKDS